MTLEEIKALPKIGRCKRCGREFTILSDDVTTDPFLHKELRDAPCGGEIERYQEPRP